MRYILALAILGTALAVAAPAAMAARGDLGGNNFDVADRHAQPAPTASLFPTTTGVVPAGPIAAESWWIQLHNSNYSEGKR